jgi:PAS domain S-box-containing protein
MDQPTQPNTLVNTLKARLSQFNGDTIGAGHNGLPPAPESPGESGVTNSLTFLYTVNPDGTLHQMWRSDLFLTDLGYEPGFMDDPQRWIELVHPEDRSHIYEQVEAVMSGTPHTVVYRVRAADGEFHWVEAYGSPVQDADGRVTQIMGAVHDITARHQADEALRASEERFRSLYRNAPIPAITWRVVEGDYEIIDYNQAMDAWTDGRAEWFPGMRAASLFPDKPEFLEAFHRCYNERTNVTFEMNYQPPGAGGDALPRDVRATVSFIGPDLLLSYVEDITEMKRANLALQISEVRLRSVMRSFPNGLIMMFDHNMRYVMVDGAVGDNTTRENILGRTLGEVVPKEGYDILEPAYRAALAGESSGGIVPFDGESYSFHTTPIRDEAGNVTAGLVITQNITKRIEMEDALRRSEQRYRALVQHFPNGIVALFDKGYRVTLVGGEQLGWNNSPDSNDFIGKTPHQLLGDDGGRLSGYMKAALAGESNVYDVEYQGRFFRVYVMPVFDDDGRINTGMIMSQDMTALREAELNNLELRVAEERADLLTEFIGNLSHDLKTPLSVINTSLHLLEQYTDPEKQKAKLASIKAQVHNLEKIIQNILLMSRLDSTANATFRPLDVNRLLVQVESELRIPAEQKGLDLRLKLEPNLPRSMGDPEQVYRAAVNLVENAIHYTEAGSITILTRSAEQTVMFEVRDTGIGIDAQHLPHIFERFYRANKARSGAEGSTGLGLSIVHKVADMHGGWVEVDSEPGEGSRFRVHLPAVGMALRQLRKPE